MLRSLKGTLNRRKDHGRSKRDLDPSQQSITTAPDIKDDELVIQTKEAALSGGYSGTALAGCAAAWTRSFNMTEAAAAKKQRDYTRPAVCRGASDNSLDLDEDIFLPEEGLPEEAAEDEELNKAMNDGKPKSAPETQHTKVQEGAEQGGDCTRQQGTNSEKDGTEQNEVAD